MLPTVLLMLKAPIPGEVKTRLGREIGFTAAAAAYRQLVEHQVRQIPADWQVHICHAPAEAAAAMRAWLGEGYGYSAQPDGDLGQRLTDAMVRHFRETPAPVMIVGGDCPYLVTERLRTVAAAMESTEVVLVPAVDGGYCLIALRRPDETLFRSISWSTGAVLAETRKRLEERGIGWRELETLEDVDELASWQRAVRAFPDLQLENRVENHL